MKTSRCFRVSFFFIWAWLLSAIANGATMVQVDPPLPSAINTEPLLKNWVETTIHDTPPVGGAIEMIKHWPPKYANNNRVGEIWIVPAVVKVVMDDGTFDHEMAFLAYHVDTDKTTIEVLYGIPPTELPKYLKASTNVNEKGI